MLFKIEIIIKMLKLKISKNLALNILFFTYKLYYVIQNNIS
jgi:hypothetical protein